MFLLKEIACLDLYPNFLSNSGSVSLFPFILSPCLISFSRPVVSKKFEINLFKLNDGPVPFERCSLTYFTKSFSSSGVALYLF